MYTKYRFAIKKKLKSANGGIFWLDKPKL